MPLLRTETLEGAARGIVTVRAPHELQAQEVAWLQDAVIDQAGMVRRRNGIPAAGTSSRVSVVTDAAAPRYPVGIATCTNPQGQLRFAILYWDTTIGFGLYGAIYDSSMNFLGREILVSVPGLPIGTVVGAMRVVTAQLPDGGCFITVNGLDSNGMNARGLSPAAIWYGCGGSTSIGANAVGTLMSSVTIARNDTVVTMAAADIAKLTPGAVIGMPSSSQPGVGVVRSIDSATTCSLVAPFAGTSLVGSATVRAAPSMYPFPYRAVGLVSAVAGGTLTGYGTKFKTLMDVPNTLPWSGAVVSQQDGQVIATFTTSAATTDTNLGTVTVLRNATMEPYRLFVFTGTVASYVPTAIASGSIAAFADIGSMPFAYKGHTFWLNKSNYLPGNSFPAVKRDTPLSQRCWISGPSGPYDFDHDPAAGAWFDVVSEIPGDQDIMCGGATPNVAIICKRKSTYLVTGDDLDSFQITKLINEGALEGSQVLPYQGGVIWFGPTGIWFYNGSSAPENLVGDTLLPTYKLWASLYNPLNFAVGAIATDHYAAYFKAFIHNDHLFLCMGSGGNPQVFSGNNTNTQDTATLVMYLPTRGANFWSNFKFVDYLPPQFNTNNTGYVLLEPATSVPGVLISVDELLMPGNRFGGLQNDNFRVRGCANISTPSFYMETKRYGLADPMNRKVWKGLAIEACFTDLGAHTSKVKVDYVQGLNPTGSTVVAVFPDTLSNLNFKAQRIKARARNQYLGYRLYEDPANKPLFLSLGAWQLMYKPGRPGAI